MFRRIRTYMSVVGTDGHAYTPRAYGDPNEDGSWAGYLGFFPAAGHVLATDQQTLAPDLRTLVSWADSLTMEDLHSALRRAKALNRQSLAEDELARLARLEHEALLDADAFDRKADLDKSAAEAARLDAELLRNEQLNLDA